MESRRSTAAGLRCRAVTGIDRLRARTGPLPRPSDRRLAVRVTPDALRHIRAGHPWVFDDSITSITDGGTPGDLAVVFDARRKFAAIALFDPTSPMRLKILHAGAAGDDRRRLVARRVRRMRSAGVDAFTAHPHADRLGYRGRERRERRAARVDRRSVRRRARGQALHGGALRRTSARSSRR